MLERNVMAGKKSRLIIDTNIWISYLLTDNFNKLDRKLLNNEIVFLYSEELIREFAEVVTRPKFKKYFSKEDIDSLLIKMEIFGELIHVTTKVNICRDSKDDFLLSLAIDGNASYLITGDKDLLDLKKISKTKIITMNNFLEI